MKIGGRLVLISEVLFVPDGEVVELSKQIAEGDLLKMKLRFPISDTQGDVPGEDRKPVIKYALVDDCFELSFENFTSALGHSTNKPEVFAMSNAGEAIAYMAAVFRQKASTKIEFQVTLGVAP